MKNNNALTYNNSKTFAFLLMEERQKRELSVKEMANLLGFHKFTVMRMESGEYDFSLKKLAKIASKLHINLEFSVSPKSKSANINKT